MEYRLAKLEDAKDIYEIVQDTIKRIYPKYYLPEIVDMFCKFHSKGNIAADIENGNTYILLENNKAIGTGTMKENHILRVYILPEFQGKGFGTYIMQQLEGEIGKRYDKAKIDASLPACKLYYNLGYKTVDHGIWECAGGVIQVYEMMEKCLKKVENKAGMNHKGTVKLETERLILRRFVIEDAKAMYENWASEDEVTKFLTWPTHSSVEDTRFVLNQWINSYEKPDFYNWAIELKETGDLIGNISVVQIKENIEGAVLGYCMGTKWWGQEIMPEAGKAVIKYLFEEVGFHRIAADHDKNNPKSGRVMQKLGMTYEGTLRSAGFCNQGVIDEVWYSILKEEFGALIGNLQ